MTAANNINNSNFTVYASDNVVMEANNINNIATDNNSNETKIEAGNIVSLNATKDSNGDGGNITNIGATISGGSLVYLTADNNITNKALIQYNINGNTSYSSGLSSGQTAANFTNTTLDSTGTSTSDTNVLNSNANYIRSTLLSQGNITSGGNLVLVAGNNINNIGSNITAEGSTYLEATNGNINITTAALRDRTLSRWGGRKKGGVSVSDNTTNLESNITSGNSGSGTLELLATSDSTTGSSSSGNINITGSSLTSADNLTLTAANDINIKSAQDTTYSFSAGRAGRGKSYLNQSSSTTQIASNLTTTNNGDITITSGYKNTDTVGSDNAFGNINIIASKLTTSDTDNDSSNNSGSGDVSLTARNEVNIASALDTFASKSLSSSKGYSVKKSSTDIKNTTTNVQSEISSNNDLTITSGSDTNITASNLSGNGSANITAGRYLDTDTSSSTYNTYLINDGANVNILNGVDTSYTYHNSTKQATGLNVRNLAITAVYIGAMAMSGGVGTTLMVGTGVGATPFVVEQKNTSTSAGSYKETVVSSNLNFTNDLNVTSGKDLTVQGSNLTTTTGDIKLTSGNDINILSAAQQSTSFWDERTKGLLNSASKSVVESSGTVNVSSIVESGNNLNITSLNDTILQSSILDSANDLTITTGNDLYLLVSQDVYSRTHTAHNNSLLKFKDSGSGFAGTNVINNQITSNNGANTNLTFDVGNTTTAQYNSKSGEEATATTIKNGVNDTTLTRDFTNSPQLSYLNTLDPSTTIYSPMDEQHMDWDYATRGLTKTGQAVIAVGAAAVAIGTGGIGSGLSGAMLTAVATTAATIATISFTNAALNADSLRESDDVGKTTLKDTTSKEALQSYVIAALTAGVTQYGAAKLNVAVPSSATTTERVTTNTLNAITRASIQTSTQIVATSIVKGQSINETIEEQGGLDQVIKNTLATAIGEAGAKEIGYQYHNYNISQPIQLTLHGVLGATTSTLMGGDALSGAAAAIAGEYTADSLYQSGLGANFSIALGQTAGSGAALLTSLLQGRSDEQTATNIQIGSFVASNAATYNATYVLKTTGRVIAADGENDHKVILIDESEANIIFDKRTEYLLANSLVPNVDEAITGVVPVSSEYQYQTNGKFYDLTIKSDFDTLAKMTGQFGISYSPETTNLIFNSNDSNDMAKIFFQNGMDNNYQTALASAKLIQDLTGQDVGLIVNSTGGIGNDISEYLPTDLYLKDALNGEVYQQIANNSDGKNLVIMHSAGNNDAYQAAKILKLNNVNLNGKIDFISVGSPISTSSLRNALGEVGGSVIGGYNNILDPVTHSKTWAVGALTLAGAGASYGATVGIGTTSTGSGLESFFTGLIGGGIGGGIGLTSLKLQHPFETYFNKNFKGLASDIQQWTTQNPSSTSQ